MNVARVGLQAKGLIRELPAAHITLPAGPQVCTEFKHCSSTIDSISEGETELDGEGGWTVKDPYHHESSWHIPRSRSPSLSMRCDA